MNGSKFQADNAKDNNFTSSKLDDRIQWLDRHTKGYIHHFDEVDKAEDGEALTGQLTREVLEHTLQEATDRLKRYKAYWEVHGKNGLSQLSITDADAKMVKNKNGFAVAYNVQTAVDLETHLIADYVVTDQVSDHGQMKPALSGLKEKVGEQILEAVADKGYEHFWDCESGLDDIYINSFYMKICRAVY